MTTARGKVNRIFIRKKIKLIGFYDRMNQDKIHMILVQKDGARLMNDIIPEQLSLKQHPLLPNIRVYRPIAQPPSFIRTHRCQGKTGR